MGNLNKIVSKTWSKMIETQDVLKHLNKTHSVSITSKNEVKDQENKSIPEKQMHKLQSSIDTFICIQAQDRRNDQR